MRYSVVITDAAAADIDDQLAYLQRVTGDAEVGQRWLLDLYESINALEEFVGYASAREAELLGAELRQKIFRTHLCVLSG